MYSIILVIYVDRREIVKFRGEFLITAPILLDYKAPGKVRCSFGLPVSVKPL